MWFNFSEVISLSGFLHWTRLANRHKRDPLPNPPPKSKPDFGGGSRVSSNFPQNKGPLPPFLQFKMGEGPGKGVTLPTIHCIGLGNGMILGWFSENLNHTPKIKKACNSYKVWYIYKVGPNAGSTSLGIVLVLPNDCPS